jgi:hypothetical protein
MTIDVSENVTIRADAGANVSSVVFKGEGAQVIRTENVPPYSIAGDINGDYFAWHPAPGTHVLFVTPYSAQQGTGTPGTSIIVSYTIVNSGGGEDD